MDRHDEYERLQKLLKQQRYIVAAEAAAAVLAAIICLISYVKEHCLWNAPVICTIALLLIYTAVLYYMERRLNRALSEKLLKEENSVR